MTAIKLKDLSIAELVNYEQACKVICMRCEKDATSYGDYFREATHEPTPAEEKFKLYHGIYINIINELEERLKGLK